MDLMNEMTVKHRFWLLELLTEPKNTNALSYLLVSFDTTDPEEDLDVQNFNAQRLETDFALQNVSGWRKFNGEEMFRSKEPSFWKFNQPIQPRSATKLRFLNLPFLANF